jgi:hypothetical protein
MGGSVSSVGENGIKYSMRARVSRERMVDHVWAIDVEVIDGNSKTTYNIRNKKDTKEVFVWGKKGTDNQHYVDQENENFFNCREINWIESEAIDAAEKCLSSLPCDSKSRDDALYLYKSLWYFAAGQYK